MLTAKFYCGPRVVIDEAVSVEIITADQGIDVILRKSGPTEHYALCEEVTSDHVFHRVIIENALGKTTHIIDAPRLKRAA